MAAAQTTVLTSVSTVGSNISSLLADITDLILRTTDVDEKIKLQAQQRKLAEKLQILVDETVSKVLPEYVEAQAKLEKAVKAAKDAKGDLSKLADAISKIATAITKVTALAAKIATLLG